MHRRAIALVATTGWVLVAAAPISAESPRAELGKRLRRFETAWQEADAERRADAVEPMSAAVRDFFTLRLASAAARLDDAWIGLLPGAPPEPAERRAVATAVAASPLLADAAAGAVSIAFDPLYEVPGADDATARMRLAIEDARGRPIAEREGPWAEATGSFDWTTGPLPEGDHRLVVEWHGEGGSVAVARLGLSRVAGLDGRLAALRLPLDAPEGISDPTARATVAAIARLLDDLAASRGQETDFPAARLLAFAERLVAEPGAAGRTIAREARGGDCWLTLSDGKAEVPVRLRAPAGHEGPLPVLFLLHGAGGSENMFFETCGAGRAVALGLERGWLVVAPRQGLFGLPLDLEAMLGILGESFALDRARVFVAGHSMGAAQTARQTSLHPELVAAAAAIGGGGSAPTGEAARRVPWFVAAGTADFGRAGAQRLARNLRAAGNRVEERSIPDVEHMVAVQAALDDLFAFLDEAAAATGTDDEALRR